MSMAVDAYDRLEMWDAMQALQHLDLRCPNLDKEMSRIPVIRLPAKPPAQHTPIAVLLKVSRCLAFSANADTHVQLPFCFGRYLWVKNVLSLLPARYDHWANQGIHAWVVCRASHDIPQQGTYTAGIKCSSAQRRCADLRSATLLASTHQALQGGHDCAPAAAANNVTIHLPSNLDGGLGKTALLEPLKLIDGLEGICVLLARYTWRHSVLQGWTA